MPSLPSHKKHNNRPGYILREEVHIHTYKILRACGAKGTFIHSVLPYKWARSQLRLRVYAKFPLLLLELLLLVVEERAMLLQLLRGGMKVLDDFLVEGKPDR